MLKSSANSYKARAHHCTRVVLVSSAINCARVYLHPYLFLRACLVSSLSPFRDVFCPCEGGEDSLFIRQPCVRRWSSWLNRCRFVYRYRASSYQNPASTSNFSPSPILRRSSCIPLHPERTAQKCSESELLAPMQLSHTKHYFLSPRLYSFPESDHY